jgi:hypothetical protein
VVGLGEGEKVEVRSARRGAMAQALCRLCMAKPWTASASYRNRIFLIVVYMSAKINGINWLFVQLILEIPYLRCLKYKLCKKHIS